MTALPPADPGSALPPADPAMPPGVGALEAEPSASPSSDPVGTEAAPLWALASPEDPAEPSGVATPDSSGTGGRGHLVAGLIAMALLGALVGAGGVALANGSLGGAAATPVVSPSPSPAPPAGNVIGSSDAPVTLEVWADYQCPYCRLEYLLFEGALEREFVIPGTARIVFRDFAFLGQESTDAAVAARCAGRQDPAAQLRLHDTLYTFQQGENQGRFVRDNLVQMAQIAGVPDTAAFTACLDDSTVAQAVADETTSGRGLGITSTPTMRLSGPGGERVLTGFSQDWTTLRDAIEAVRAPAPSPGASGSPAPSGSPAASAAPASPSPTATAAP